MKSMRRLGIISALTILAVFSFGTAFAGTVEGTVQGLQCITKGMLCPLDRQDPHIAAEKVFGIFTETKDYYLVTNIDRAILARYLGKKVRVKGKVSSKYKAITADKLEVLINGKWRTKWTREKEKYEFEIYG